MAGIWPGIHSEGASRRYGTSTSKLRAGELEMVKLLYGEMPSLNDVESMRVYEAAFPRLRRRSPV